MVQRAAVVLVLALAAMAWWRWTRARSPPPPLPPAPRTPPPAPYAFAVRALDDFDRAAAGPATAATVRELYRLRGLALGQVHEMRRRLPNDLAAEVGLEDYADSTAKALFDRIEDVKRRAGTGLTVGPIDDMHYGHWTRAANDADGLIAGAPDLSPVPPT